MDINDRLASNSSHVGDDGLVVFDSGIDGGNVGDIQWYVDIALGCGSSDGDRKKLAVVVLN